MQLYRIFARRDCDAASIRAIAMTLVAAAGIAVALGVLRVEREHEVLSLGYQVARETAHEGELRETLAGSSLSARR